VTAVSLGLDLASIRSRCASSSSSPGADGSRLGFERFTPEHAPLLMLVGWAG
jgi:hypothetical protein